MDRSGTSEAKHKALAGLCLGLRTGSLHSYVKASQLNNVLDRRRLSIDKEKMASAGVAPALREAHAKAVDVVASIARQSLGLLTGVAPATASSKAAQLDRVLDSRRLSIDRAKLEEVGVAPELQQAHSAALTVVANVTRHSLQIVAGATVEDDVRILNCAREAAAAAVARAVASSGQGPATQTARSVEPPAPVERPAAGEQLAPADVSATRQELARVLEASLESGALGAAIEETVAPRRGLVRALEAALDSGALKAAMDDIGSRDRPEEEQLGEAAVSAPAVAATSPKLLETTRLKVARASQEAFASGRLQAVMDQMATESKKLQESQPSPQQERGKEEKLERQRALALAAFKRLSEQDRRLGELHGVIAAMRQRLSEKLDCCKEMEGSIQQARGQVEHLALNIDWHKQALKDAEKRSEELEIIQRKLALAPSLQVHRAAEADDLKGLSVDSEPSMAMGTRAGSALRTASASFPALSGLRPALEPIAPRC